MRLTLLVITGVAVVSAGCAHRGDVIDSWETRTPAVKVRVRQFDEKPKYFMPHYYFAFEVENPVSPQWREILTWKVDDPIPIQRQQVQFVTDSIVYAFGNAKYVVSTDSGLTWSEWDAARELQNRQAYTIREVHVARNGTGGLVVKCRTRTDSELLRLRTSDFGVHWTPTDGLTSPPVSSNAVPK